jgi:YVTN family beta-propeller protein
MSPIFIRKQWGSYLQYFIVFICLFLFYACGSNTETSVNASSSNGSIAFSIVWKGGLEISSSQKAVIRSPSGDVCADYLIETINATVYNSNNAIVATKSWPCSDHGGTIPDVPTGSGIRVVIEGRVAGIVLWSGEATGITVSAGQTYNVGTITVNYIGSDQTPPEVDSKNPDGGATGVPLNSVITATFSEAVVPASVNSSTFTLTTGGGSISGQVDYNPGTLTATFTPTVDLTPSTQHTATITTDVEDLAGIQMALPASWSFTTLVVPPTATTGSATSMTSSSATLNGTVNPNGASTNYYFEYGLTTSYGSNTTSTSVGSGTTAVPVSDGISGLSPGNTYHFRIVATNAGGTNFGSDQTFTTGIDPPTVTTGSATSVTSSSATLNGSVNPNGYSTNYYFEYGLTTSYGSNTTSTSAGSGTTAVPVSGGISGLSPGNTYHFRIVATNAGGTNFGSDQTFTTEIDPPTVTTESAYSVTSSSATLNGSVNPNGASTNYYFEYGLTTGYGSVTTSTNVGSGTTAVSVSDGISGLNPGTIYHFRIVATNGGGTSYGLDDTFITTTNRAYVANSGDATVSVIDIPFNVVMDTIAVGNGPWAVAVYPDQDRAYVTNYLDDTVSIIDTTTDTVMSTIGVGDNPQSVAVNPVRNKAYVANMGAIGSGNDTVTIIDTTNNQVITTVPVGQDPTGVAVADSGTASGVFVALMSGEVDVIDVTTDTVTNTITVPGTTPCPSDIAYQAATYRMYVLDNTCNAPLTANGYLSTILSTTKAVAGPYILGAGGAAASIAANPNVGGRIYVTHPQQDTLTVTEYVSHSLEDEITVGDFPSHVAFDGPNERVYVTNTTSNNVSVIDINTNSVVDTIAVGSGPRGIAVMP